MSSDSIDILTPDLLTQILVKLPVKTLLCCKSVSKPWLSLISSPYFISFQLRQAPGADQSFIDLDEDDNLLYRLNLNSTDIQSPLGLPYSEGDFSFEPDFKIVGCYNGIVCVSVSDLPHSGGASCWGPNYRYTYIWNPATRQSKLIPPPLIAGDADIGFGFDSIGNDFKVLWISNSWDKPFCAQVYSANTNIWRMVVDPSPADYLVYAAIDVCVNGFLCCMGSNGMIAFDLNTEVMVCGIRVPDDESAYSQIKDFNDSVAFITRESKLNVYNLWTLDDEACLRGGEAEASWTLKLSIEVDFPSRLLPPCVYGCFNSGDFLFYIHEGVFLLYNPHTEEARNVPVSNIIGGRLIKYNESLVSITGSEQVHWNAQGNDI